MAPNVTKAVYAAEDALAAILDRAYDAPTVEMFGSKITVPIERKFAELNSMQAYVDQVLALNWVQDTYPRAKIPVLVRERKGQTQAHYESWSATIAIPPYVKGKAWAMRELVILHELAHHLQRARESHGPEFCSVFVHLVSEIMGTEAGFLLRTLFHLEDCTVA